MRGARRLLAGLLALGLALPRAVAADVSAASAGAEGFAVRPLPSAGLAPNGGLSALPGALALLPSAPALVVTALSAAPALAPSALSAPAPVPAADSELPALAAAAAAGNDRSPSAAPSAPAALRADAPREFFGGPRARAGGLASAIRAHALARGFRFSAPAADSDEAAAAPDLIETPAAAAPALAPASLPRALRATLVNQVFVSAGVESLGLAATQIARERFGDGALGPLSSASSVALGLGSLAGGHAVDRFGPERVYVVTLALRALIVAGMGGLFAAGALTLPALIGLFSLDYTMHSANFVALDALGPRRLGSSPAALSRYGQLRQIVVDAVGFAGPIGAGLLVASRGYAPVFWAYPVLFLGASVAGWLSLPRGDGAGARGPARESGPGLTAVARELAADRGLRAAVAGYALMNVIGMSVYFLFGPAFGAYAAAAAGGSAAQISSVTTGLFAGGGIFGALALPRLARAAEKSAASAADPHAAAARNLTRTIAAALALTAAALLGLWSLLRTAPLAHLALFGLSIPLFAGQFAMVPLGAALVIPLVGLMSVVQSRAAPESRAKALGLNRFAAMAASFVFSGALGFLLRLLSPTGHAGFAAFVGLASSATLLAAACLGAAAALRRSADAASAPRK
jgi:hypothetical protein